MKLINQEKDRFNLEVREIGDELRDLEAGRKAKVATAAVTCAWSIAPRAPRRSRASYCCW